MSVGPLPESFKGSWKTDGSNGIISSQKLLQEGVLSFFECVVALGNLFEPVDLKGSNFKKLVQD